MKSKYETDIKPHIPEIRDAVKAGATIKEIANAFGINESTIYEYKNKYKEFAEAFACGRACVIFNIKAALLKKALGFEYVEERTTGKKKDGKEQIEQFERYKRYSPPSETAAAMLLRNYDAKWIEHDEVSTKLKKEDIKLKKVMTEEHKREDSEKNKPIKVQIENYNPEWEK